jgi:hypothetical protein
MGTREETERLAAKLTTIVTVQEVSPWLPNRGASILGRVYITAEFPPD